MTHNEPLGGVPGRNHTIFADCPISEQPHQFVCKVIATGDGDTCTIAIEMPNRQSWVVNLRYQHCFAPERSETGGVATSNFNASLVKDQWGTVLTKGRMDQRSRLLGDLFIYVGKGVPLMDVSKTVQQFVTENGYGTGNG